MVRKSPKRSQRLLSTAAEKPPPPPFLFRNIPFSYCTWTVILIASVLFANLESAYKLDIDTITRFPQSYCKPTWTSHPNPFAVLGLPRPEIGQGREGAIKGNALDEQKHTLAPVAPQWPDVAVANTALRRARQCHYPDKTPRVFGLTLAQAARWWSYYEFAHALLVHLRLFHMNSAADWQREINGTQAAATSRMSLAKTAVGEEGDMATHGNETISLAGHKHVPMHWMSSDAKKRTASLYNILKLLIEAQGIDNKYTHISTSDAEGGSQEPGHEENKSHHKGSKRIDQVLLRFWARELRENQRASFDTLCCDSLTSTLPFTTIAVRLFAAASRFISAFARIALPEDNFDSSHRNKTLFNELSTNKTMSAIHTALQYDIDVARRLKEPQKLLIKTGLWQKFSEWSRSIVL